MTLRSKIIVTAVLPLIVTLVLGGVIVLEQVRTGERMNSVVALSEAIDAISKLVHESQKERGLSAAHFGATDGSFTGKLSTQRAVVDERLAELDAVFEAHGLEAGAVLAAFDKARSNRAAVDGRSVPLGVALGTITGAHHEAFSWIEQRSALSDRPELVSAQLGHV